MATFSWDVKRFRAFLGMGGPPLEVVAYSSRRFVPFQLKQNNLDETVRVRGYTGALRQLAIAGLGRDEPTLCLSNNFQAKAREVMTRHVGRNGIEDALGISVNFFHLDCLASEVRLNVDLDVALTVI